MKLRSILLSMLAVLAIGFTSLSLTSCSDDDDDNGGNKTPAKTAIINGTSFSIDNVWAAHPSSGNCWIVWLCDADDDDIISILLYDEFLGKENKLTDDLTRSGEHSYIGLEKIVNKSYTCGEDFKSGTIKMSANESTQNITVTLSGETNDGNTFSANYSGPFEWD